MSTVVATTARSRSRSPAQKQRGDAKQNEEHSALVVSLGLCTLDTILVVDTFPTPDAKQQARNEICCGGGNAANTAAALARLGQPVRFISNVGPDNFGRTIREELEREGVDCEYLLIGERTIKSHVIVCGNSRTIISTPLAQRRYLGAADVHPGMLDGATLLHLDARHPHAARRLAEAARSRRIPVLVEAELRNNQCQLDEAELLQFADYVITSEQYPCIVTGEKTVELGLRALLQTKAPNARWAVASLGERGSVAVNRGDVSDATAWTEVNAAAWPVSVVDSTGAGDAFIAGLAYSIVQKLSISKTLTLANWVGSKNCQALGARIALPTQKELADALNLEERFRSCE